MRKAWILANPRALNPPRAKQPYKKGNVVTYVPQLVTEQAVHARENQVIEEQETSQNDPENEDTDLDEATTLQPPAKKQRARKQRPPITRENKKNKKFAARKPAPINN